MPVIKKENGNGGKRKAKAEADAEDLVIVGTKRRKTEQEYFKEQLESNLKEAREFALEGNKILVDYHISQATEKATKLNINVSAKASKIRSLVTPLRQHEFVKKKLNFFLESAQQFAIQGNQSLMEFELGQAQKLASQFYTLLEQYESQASVISQSLTIDKANSFLREAVTQQFAEAEFMALEGNRDMMMFHLRQAKEKQKNWQNWVQHSGSVTGKLKAL